MDHAGLQSFVRVQQSLMPLSIQPCLAGHFGCCAPFKRESGAWAETHAHLSHALPPENLLAEQGPHWWWIMQDCKTSRVCHSRSRISLSMRR